MGYGFLRAALARDDYRVVLVITRDTVRTGAYLRSRGFPTEVTDSPSAIARNADGGIVSLCSDPAILGILHYRIVVEMTGDVVYGTEVALKTMEANKHLVTMSVGMHVTVGSALLRRFQSRGLVLTEAEGDQPGSLARLREEVLELGFKPIMAGNLKHYLDRYATPRSVRFEAAKRGLSLDQTTQFTDGTKICLEMNLVANYFGMRCLARGMHGYGAERVEDALTLFDWEGMDTGGFVDYLIGMDLPPGVFMVCEHQDRGQARYLKYLGLGTGPRYVLYRHYHLCHLEVFKSISRLLVSGQSTMDNSMEPIVDTIAVAKKDLEAGKVLDGMGGYCCYGLIENRDTVVRESLVPVGLVKDAVLTRAVRKDDPFRLDDLQLPENTVTRLWRETHRPALGSGAGRP
jgi:predicted homoserine dehydrogenase-like protein